MIFVRILGIHRNPRILGVEANMKKIEREKQTQCVQQNSMCPDIPSVSDSQFLCLVALVAWQALVDLRRKR